MKLSIWFSGIKMELLSSYTSELFVCQNKIPDFNITEKRGLYNNVMVSLVLISFFGLSILY